MSISVHLQPVLENDIIRLQPLKEEDFEELYSVASDPLLWEQHPEPLRYKRDVFERFFKKAIDSQGALLLIDKTKNKAIGCSRYYEYNDVHNTIAIGYTFIGREYWGTGYNVAMKILMLDHILSHVHKVYFHIGINNIRSQKAIERLGADKLERMDPEHENHLIYEIDGVLWNELKSRLR